MPELRIVLLASVGLLAFSLGADGGSSVRTNKFPRVKLPLAVPAQAVIKPQANVTTAVPALTEVKPIEPVHLSERISVVLAGIGPIDTSEVTRIMTEAIGSASSAEIAQAVVQIAGRATQAELIAVIASVFSSVSEKTREELWVKAVASATTAEAAAALVAACRGLEPAAFITIVEMAFQAAPEHMKVSLLAAAFRSMPTVEAERQFIPCILAVRIESTPTAVIVDLIEALTLATEQYAKVNPIPFARAASEVKSPEWYDLRLYDGGTGLWAIATKAKWYAERGNRKKVEELYRYFVKVMLRAEMAEQGK